MEISTGIITVCIISFAVSVIINICLYIYIRKLRQNKTAVLPVVSPEVSIVEKNKTETPGIARLEINPFKPTPKTEIPSVQEKQEQKQEARPEEVLVPASLPPALELTPQLYHDENLLPKQEVRQEEASEPMLQPEKTEQETEVIVETPTSISTTPRYPDNINNPEACEYCGKTGLKNKAAHRRFCKKRSGIP